MELKYNIPLRSGLDFDFTDMSKNVVTMTDIAHGLSNVCRFAGQCPEFYSVAQHSVLVASILEHTLGVKDRAILLQGLMHDASESVLGDVTTPLKKLLPDYYVIEERVQSWMMAQLDVMWPMHDLVKKADLLALAVEKKTLLKNTDRWAVLVNNGIDEDHIVDTPFDAALPFDAFDLFLEKYAELTC